MTIRIDPFDVRAVRWRKSSYSDSSSAQCIEVAYDFGPALVPVRDSKDPHGPALIFTGPAWQGFVNAVKRGDLPEATA
jgi:Domain of unknown function (DUF397)